MKTRKNRITIVQRRAKRRVLLIAIGAIAFAGYSAAALFAFDSNAPVTKDVAQSPAVRSVGIRMMKQSGTGIVEPKPVNTTTQLPSTASSVLGTSNPAQLLLPDALPAPASKLATEPAPMLMASPSTMPNAVAAVPPPRMQDLTPPPTMAEISGQRSSGTVKVKLASDRTAVPTLSPKPIASVPKVSQLPQPADPIVNIHVIPIAPAAPPTKMPGISFAEAPKPKASEPAKGEVRVTLGDSSTSNMPSLVSMDRKAEVSSIPIPSKRTPELIKPKPTSVTQTVTLASAPEIHLTDTDEATNEELENAKDAMVALTPPPVTTSLPAVKNEPALLKSQPIAAKPMPIAGIQVSPSVEIAQFGNDEEQAEDLQLPVRSGQSFDKNWATTAPIVSVEMESQSVTTIDIPGGIRDVGIENENICRVLFNPRSISIVGNKSGTSLVQVWTNDVKDVPQLIKINVSQPWQKPSSKPSDLNEVKQAINIAFPDAKIKLVSNKDGTLEVRGTVESESSARKVLEIVRKLCLVPVKDKVIVSN